jgi:hypothetical protein
MAEQFGEEGEWGISSSQTGIVSESTSYNFTSESKILRGIDGEVDGKAYYAGQMEATMSGYIPSSSGFNTKVGDSVSLSLSPDALSIGTISIYVVESVTQTYSNEDFARVEVRAVGHDGLT